MKKHIETIKIMDSKTATLKQMPKYNPYQTGHGVIGDTKYNRNKDKKEAETIINEEYDDLEG